ncbi:snoRNA-binding rRNA-processing protein [Teratosphaeriaceae sp. CCFEE 6253]|nr:snoRNA-binding rRNA-processing protein [Teratosphaeriaceae sp. CCFEE 6253]
MPRTARSTSFSRPERRHNPLSEEYWPSLPLKQKAGKKRKQSHTDDVPTQDGYVDSKASRRILDLGATLIAEDDAEREAKRPATASSVFDGLTAGAVPRDVVSDEDEDDGALQVEDDGNDAWGSDGDEAGGAEVDPNDLDTFNKFHPTFDPATLLQPAPSDNVDAEGPPANMYDLLLAKMATHEAQQPATKPPPIRGGGEMADAVELPALVVEVYTQIATLLSRYKSGPLPKPLKVLPTVPQWEILLSITRPEQWTPNAVYEATKLFTSARPALAQAFVQDVLLPRVREDILETKKLNVHLYKALKKSLYKPAAFFQGCVFPLVDSGTCTLREATIVASVVARVSIPVLHSATAIYRLCEIADEQMAADVESAGACNILLRTLLEKKYALPYQVVDAVVDHFMRLRIARPDGDADTRMSGAGGKSGAMDYRLPVLWHQCLLAFAQRYKHELTEDQREGLLDLLMVRGHKQIGPEVRRELLEGRGRGVPVAAIEGDGGRRGEDGDDTMTGA